MDFGGFLVQMRVELERSAVTLPDLPVPAETDEPLDAPPAAATAEERCR